MEVSRQPGGVATRPETTAARPSGAGPWPRAMRSLRARAAWLLASGAMVVMSANTWAQGGPPMVTDDPGTPGDGHWEINLGAIGTRTPGHWEIAAPDADINYGWGEHIQLKVDVPWLTTRDDGQHWKSDFGDVALGVKWRFLDQDEAGVSVSTYPQYTRHLLESS